MNKNHNEAVAGMNAFQIFSKQFGPDDIYTRIILEVLFEEILNQSYHSKEKEENKNATENH